MPFKELEGLKNKHKFAQKVAKEIPLLSANINLVEVETEAELGNIPYL